MAEGAHFLTKQDGLEVQAQMSSPWRMVPRVSRARKMEALSSMANIADYRAVIKAGANIGLLHRADHRCGQGVWKRPESLTPGLFSAYRLGRTIVNDGA
ncbi:hypothetical protein IE4872_PB00052 (plasmid) [Rhizobium gallicum]|uniref:Uncharacterized protein n=1 Tax=Rhizobium gallicum TaxID=56730 RepID=A0A1L5NPT8_9HYPH|nr:hypothetical protein IE4872_PB00052 [Rhizobium gallicum]